MNNYFWRHKNRQEIDWIEEDSSNLTAYELKWNTNTKVNAPSLWSKTYLESKFTVVSPDNYLDFIV